MHYPGRFSFKTPVFLDAFVGLANLVGSLGGDFHHFFRQAFRHQLVRVVLAHQAAVGFFHFGVAGVLRDVQYRIGVVQGYAAVSLLAMMNSAETDARVDSSS